MNIFKTYILFIFYVLFFCCNSKNNFETEKKKGIPKSAFRAGNDKYENWFDVEWIHPHKNNAIISIYDNQNGKLIIKKKFFKICPIDDLKFIETLKEEIDFYDGNKIHLKDNCYLQ